IRDKLVTGVQTCALPICGLVAVLLRGAALVGMAAAVGAAIASLGRNTSAALGAAFGYLVVLEGILRGWKPWTQRWLLGNNAASRSEEHTSELQSLAYLVC